METTEIKWIGKQIQTEQREINETLGKAVVLFKVRVRVIRDVVDCGVNV